MICPKYFMQFVKISHISRFKFSSASLNRVSRCQSYSNCLANVFKRTTQSSRVPRAYFGLKQDKIELMIRRKLSNSVLYGGDHSFKWKHSVVRRESCLVSVFLLHVNLALDYIYVASGKDRGLY